MAMLAGSCSNSSPSSTPKEISISRTSYFTSGRCTSKPARTRSMVSRVRPSGEACHSKAIGIEPARREQGGERLAVLVGLAAALVVERNILAPLIAALGIPGRFTMPDEVDFRPDQGCHVIPAPLSRRVLSSKAIAPHASEASVTIVDFASSRHRRESRSRYR